LASELFSMTSGILAALAAVPAHGAQTNHVGLLHDEVLDRRNLLVLVVVADGDLGFHAVLLRCKFKSIPEVRVPVQRGRHDIGKGILLCRLFTGAAGKEEAAASRDKHRESEEHEQGSFHQEPPY
jgi:hypothetical protein